MIRKETIAEDVTIYLGDNREILPTLGPVDAIVTDPPYGLREAAGKNKSRSVLAVSKDYGTMDWDNQPPAPWVIALMRDISHHQIIFGGSLEGTHHGRWSVHCTWLCACPAVEPRALTLSQADREVD